MSDGRRNYQADKEKLRMAKNLVKSNNKKIKKALKEIDGWIGIYEYEHKMFVTSDQPDKVDVTKRSIDRFDKIRKILEE